MALPGSGVVAQGRQRYNINVAAVGGSSTIGSSQTTTRYWMTMGFDDNAANFADTDTAQNTRGALTNYVAQLFDGFATQSGQTITMVCTLATGTGNFVIKGIGIHDDSVANSTAGGANLQAGIAGLSLTKASTFSLAFTLKCLVTDNS